MDKFYSKGLLFFSFFIFLFTQPLHAQESNAAFDSIYVDAATTLSATNIQKALEVADSLLKNAENSVQEMKSLMLVATLKGRTGAVTEALSNAIQAATIAAVSKNYEWQVRIGGFLSTTFRQVNLTEEARKYLDIAEKANAKANVNSPRYPLIQGFIHQEKAYYHIEEQEYQLAIEELFKAEKQILKLPRESRNEIFLGTNFQLLGSCYLRLNEDVKAQEYYQRALYELGTTETELKAFVYTGLGEIKLNAKQFEEAYAFFKNAEVYIETSDNFNLKSSLYKNLSTYYAVIGNKEKAIEYNALYIDFMDEYTNSTKEVFNNLIKQLNVEKNKKIKNINFLIGISALFLISIVAVWLYFKKLNKQERLRYEEVIRNIKELAPLSVNHYSPITLAVEKNVTRGAPMMPRETEERLLNELVKLEEELFFIQPELSLSSLATKLQTNPKYLSYVINTHKKKDFNNYINELRVRYSIEMLHNDPEVLHYKISYIAEKCGFSSHSKFGSVFKTLTGLSPSVFISHLRKDQVEP